MSLVRGRFGIEYSAKPRRNNSSGSSKFVIALIVVVAVISFAISSTRKYFASKREAILALEAEEAIRAQEATQKRTQAANEIKSDSSSENAESENAGDSQDGEAAKNEASPPPQEVLAPPPPPLNIPSRNSRQVKVKNLLMKLEEAEKQSNIVMAIATIEEIRNLPGGPVADIDDSLARRLGELNVKWLFELGNKQWITEVKVRPGENATRIAKSHGSTLESLIRLNRISNANNIKIGSTIKVMNHPRLNLIVHRRAKYADLQLNGKFFNRYDLLGDVSSGVGLYKAEQNPRAQLDKLGIRLSRENRDEIASLLPANCATISISEF